MVRGMAFTDTVFCTKKLYGDRSTVIGLHITSKKPVEAKNYKCLSTWHNALTYLLEIEFGLQNNKTTHNRTLSHILQLLCIVMSAALFDAFHLVRFASADEQLSKLLELLDGKEITSAGHLSARNFSFSDEIMMEEDGKLNFYVEASFDVDAVFGTFVLTDKNDDWLNIYANYDIAEDRPCDTLELTLCKGDGSEENWSYPLNAAEQDVLLRKMDAFCMEQTGMSLREYAQQLHEEQAQTAELQL